MRQTYHKWSEDDIAYLKAFKDKLTPVEIAQKLHCSTKRVSNKLARIRKQARESSATIAEDCSKHG